MRYCLLAVLLSLLPASAHAVIPKLQVNVISANAETVWVAVTPPPNICGVWTPGPYCPPLSWTTYSISPCPLGRPCSAGTYTRYFANTFIASDTLALDPQASYTFGGSYDCANQHSHPIYGCAIEFSNTYYYDPYVFSYAPTPTVHRSWGALKSVYR